MLQIILENRCHFRTQSELYLAVFSILQRRLLPVSKLDNWIIPVHLHIFDI
jgi:hypothetical protein